MGNACIEPLSWGWKKSKGKMMPLEMSKPIALPQLLKVIRCNFKTDCSRNNVPANNTVLIVPKCVVNAEVCLV